MRILEAIEILETAVTECKGRSIDTPEVAAALDALAPYSRSGCIQDFKEHLKQLYGKIPR